MTSARVYITNYVCVAQLVVIPPAHELWSARTMTRAQVSLLCVSRPGAAWEMLPFPSRWHFMYICIYRIYSWRWWKHIYTLTWLSVCVYILKNDFNAMFAGDTPSVPIDQSLTWDVDRVMKPRVKTPRAWGSWRANCTSGQTNWKSSMIILAISLNPTTKVFFKCIYNISSIDYIFLSENKFFRIYTRDTRYENKAREVLHWCIDAKQ